MTDTTQNSGLPPIGTGFEPAAPLGETGATFTPAGGATLGADPAGGGETGSDGDETSKGSAAEQIKGHAQRLVGEAGEQARKLAEDGKGRAGDALDELSRMIHDAADQVDAKLGGQYGQYARQAADQVSRLSDGIKAKQVDDLVSDARQLVAKSPAIAIGVAAALGFVVARIVKAGVDAGGTGNGGTEGGQA